MKSPNFLLHKIQVELNMHGVEYVFNRSSIDKFGQPTNELSILVSLKGIYHESNSYIQTVVGESTVTRTKKSPMILCLFEDGMKLRQGDMVTINDKQYKVSGILDIQNYSVVCDISLEEVI